MCGALSGKCHSQGAEVVIQPQQIGLAEISLQANQAWNQHFYRAMLCKRGLCCLAVSVRPSVTFVDHVKTNKHIFEIFSPSSSDTILVFPSQTGCRYSDGNPLIGASNARGMIKCRFFSQISRCISETVIIRWAHAARQFVSIEFSFHPYNI